MGGKAPKAPPAPDPYVVAGAQTGSNVQTAIANAYLGNANENSPLGTTRYTVDKMQKVKDPVSGRVYSVPTFTRTTKLSPDQQRLLDQQNAIGSELNTMALSQSKRLASHLSRPFDLNSVKTQAPGDFEPYRQKVEDAMMVRLNDQFSRDEGDLESKLVNQGLTRGSEAFTREMDQMGRNRTDARIQAYLASGQEARAAGTYQGTNREREVQEMKLMRDQPINEITALMSGGQVSMPQFTPYRPSEVAQTPVGQYVYQSAAIDQANADRAAQERASMFGALGSIGAGLFRWSDARVKNSVRFVYTDAAGIAWYTFLYNGYEHLGPQLGVMAQELIDVSPEAVHVDPETGFYFVDYSRV